MKSTKRIKFGKMMTLVLGMSFAFAPASFANSAWDSIEAGPSGSEDAFVENQGDVSFGEGRYLYLSDGNLWEKANGWTNGGMFNCTWRSENANYYDGKVYLKLNEDAPGSFPRYASGEYRTRGFYHYGMYEVNMKPAKNVGTVSSFFTYTGPMDNNPWDEIDIEFLGKDTSIIQFNYFTNGQGNHEKVYQLGFDASTNYHTYAFNWQRNYIAWYVDGREVYRATENIPSTSSKIMMNLWPGIGVDNWLGSFDGRTPLHASYDWVKYTPN